jgi:hypothetical protein
MVILGAELRLAHGDRVFCDKRDVTGDAGVGPVVGRLGMGAVDLFDFGGFLGIAGLERLVVRTPDDLEGEQVFPIAEELGHIDGERLAAAFVEGDLAAVEVDARPLLDTEELDPVVFAGRGTVIELQSIPSGPVVVRGIGGGGDPPVVETAAGHHVPAMRHADVRPLPGRLGFGGPCGVSALIRGIEPEFPASI